jgi:hypothetical protein
MMEEALPTAPLAVEFALAVVHMHLGHVDAALDAVERMIEGHAGGCVFIGSDPCLGGLRGNERFERQLRRVGVPTASARHTVPT